MRKGAIPGWLMVTLAAVGLVMLAPALWVVVSITATPLYRTPESVPAVQGAPVSPRWAAAAERGRGIARASVAGQNLPGLSVAAGVDGELAWAEGFGFADLRSSAVVTPKHRFRIGTASTVLTSAAVGVLLETGGLRLDDEIRTHVGEYPQSWQRVTLRQLMGQTPGIAPGGGGEAALFTRHCERPADVLKHYPGEWQALGSGEQYRYSIYNWILVSAAIEGAAAMPFERFLRERVFERLGMRDTGAGSGAAEADDDFPLANLVRELYYDPRAARGAGGAAVGGAGGNGVTQYYPRFASAPRYGLHLMRPMDYSCYAGAGGIESTPADLVRFGMAMGRGELLQRGTAEVLQRSGRLASGDESGWGLGWYQKTVRLAGRPARVIGQDGDVLGGRVASLVLLPEYGVAVAAVSNIAHADTYSPAMRIAEAFVERRGSAGGGLER